MRQILILLALACAPAFCQDDNAHIQFNYNPQWFPKIELLKLPPVMKVQPLRVNALCAIPLLNVKAAANPVPMPGASVQREPRVFDRIAAKRPRPPAPRDNAD